MLNVDLTLMFNFCGDIWGWGEQRGMKNGEREEIREGRGKGQSQPAVTTFDCSVNASLQLELRPGANLQGDKLSYFFQSGGFSAYI